jgi:hypothetical protein
MKHIVLAGMLVFPLAAMAQQPQQQAPPEQAALGQMVIEAAQREAALRAQLIAAQSHIASLEAAPKPAPVSDPPAKIVAVPNAASPAPEVSKPADPPK